tara:strand:- start:3453 stop:4163 length:711 start_codon:yes stop_codon:yes gene_type:complete
MAVGYNPRIVTDGLVLALDAGNTKSYPGSGSTWTDLVQGITFSSSGTQTPLEVKEGATSFAFNDSGYWESDSGDENVDMGGDCTLLMWVYCEDITVRSTIFEKAGVEYQSYQHEIAVTWETNENFTWYSRYSPNYDSAATTALTQNTWNLVGIKMSTGRTSSARTGFYSINGSNWTSNYNSRSDTALLSGGAIRIGSGYAGAIESGNIAVVMCYEKMLTDAEVKQNFNALRGRFGI